MKYLILLLMIGCSPKPRFNVGDCIAFYFKAGEFTPARTTEVYFIIIKVGKSNYLYYKESYNEYDEDSIEWLDRDVHVKVKCENLTIRGEDVLKSLNKVNHGV